MRLLMETNDGDGVTTTIIVKGACRSKVMATIHDRETLPDWAVQGYWYGYNGRRCRCLRCQPRRRASARPSA
jgi:hypothetical protein